jgi:hypothetical protein
MIRINSSLNYRNGRIKLVLEASPREFQIFTAIAWTTLDLVDHLDDVGDSLDLDDDTRELLGLLREMWAEVKDEST